MATYYVSATGGTGAGTSPTTAWSAAYALTKVSTLVAGDTILFNKGDTFYGNFGSSHSGTSGNIITYGSYGTGANPILTGFTNLTPTVSTSSWIQYSGNVYYYNIAVTTSAYVNLVTLDSTVRQQGRYPRNSWNTYASCTAQTLTDTSIGSLPFNPTGGQVVNRKARYVIDRNVISGVSGNTLTFTNDTVYGNNSAYPPVATNGYFIQTHLGCLTTSGNAQDGDWYYDSTNHKLYMYFASTPTGRNVQISTLDNTFTISQSYITINNIDIIGGQQANVLIESGGTPNNCVINSCGIKQSGGSGVYVALSGTITISNCIISDSLNNGVFFEYADTTAIVTNNTVTNSGLIRGAGLSGVGEQSGIQMGATNVTCTNNTIVNSGYNGIDFSSSGTGLIQYNLIDTFNLIKDDGGGIYTYQGTGATVDSNIILNGIGAYDGSINSFYYAAYGWSCGVYLDNGVTNHNATVTNNVIKTGAWIGIFINDNGGNTITGNLVYDFGISQLAITDYNKPRGLTITNNQFVARLATQYCSEITLGVVDTIGSFGTFNYNIYARPIQDNTTFQVAENYSGGTTVSITLAQWQAAYGLDTDSNKSAVIATTVATYVFIYNATSSATSTELTGNYKDVAGTNYSGSVTLQPFTGLFLVPSPSKKFIVNDGKFIVNSGKFLYANS